MSFKKGQKHAFLRNVNIKVNEEEKAEWIKYHNRLDKFDFISIPVSIITVMITLTIYVSSDINDIKRLTELLSTFYGC